MLCFLLKILLFVVFYFSRRDSTPDHGVTAGNGKARCPNKKEREYVTGRLPKMYLTGCGKQNTADENGTRGSWNVLMIEDAREEEHIYRFRVGASSELSRPWSNRIVSKMHKKTFWRIEQSGKNRILYRFSVAQFPEGSALSESGLLSSLKLKGKFGEAINWSGAFVCFTVGRAYSCIFRNLVD